MENILFINCIWFLPSEKCFTYVGYDFKSKSSYKWFVQHNYKFLYRRIREKFEKEIKDLENAEKESKAKFIDSKTKLLECEELVIGLKSTVKHLELQLAQYKEVNYWKHFLLNLRTYFIPVNRKSDQGACRSERGASTRNEWRSSQFRKGSCTFEE